MHIAAKWRELAERHGDHAAIVDDHGTWSYRALHARIARLGNALAGLGLSKGDRIALLIPDIREYLEADYAIMSAGFVRVPLDPRLRGPELVALQPPVPQLDTQLWVLTHPDLRQVARVRAFAQYLFEALSNDTRLLH